MGGHERLRVEVLGPVRVIDAAGTEVTPEGLLQRRLFALLVLRRDRVVSADAAIDALWPERPPGTRWPRCTTISSGCVVVCPMV